MACRYNGTVNITLTPELQKLVAGQVQRGSFKNANDVVAAALHAMEENIVGSAPVYPPGSLLHLYTSEANAEEAKTAAGSSLEVEDW